MRAIKDKLKGRSNQVMVAILAVLMALIVGYRTSRPLPCLDCYGPSASCAVKLK